MKALLMLFFTSILVCSCDAQPEVSTVVIINQSSKKIESGTLEVCGQSFKLPILSIQEEFEINYENFSDCHYSINIKFSSGKEIKEELGYITKGFALKDRILVGDKTVAIERE